VESTQTSPLHPWFALRVRSNFERITSEHLRCYGYEVFAPTYRVVRRWSDRRKEVDLPLFSGYVFSRFDPAQRLPVMMTAGVLHIVSRGRIPMPVDEREIEAVRTMVASHLPTQPWPFLKVGQMVLIERGPLAGLEGILLQVKSGYRLVVSVSLLQRSVAAEVGAECVRPIKPRPVRTATYRESPPFEALLQKPA
jgi:transcriptional antiterminator NusG